MIALAIAAVLAACAIVFFPPQTGRRHARSHVFADTGREREERKAGFASLNTLVDTTLGPGTRVRPWGFDAEVKKAYDGRP